MQTNNKIVGFAKLLSNKPIAISKWPHENTKHGLCFTARIFDQVR